MMLGDQSVVNPASPEAQQIDLLWRMFFWTCGAIWGAVVVVLARALWRRRATETSETAMKTSVTLATVASVVILIVFFLASVIIGSPIREMGVKDPVSVRVTGNQWWWAAQYDAQIPQDTITTANELHVPIGREVLVTLLTNDVIHSFWVPNLMGKMDAIPLRTNALKFRADKAGLYRGQCAEFCGLQHAHMALFVYADPQDKYDAWVSDQKRSSRVPAPGSMEEKGLHVFLNSPCVLCHSIRGTTASASFGPDLTHLASRKTIAAGTLLNNRGNLGGWITNAQGVKPGTKMPSINVAPQDLQPLLAYLESLQ